MVKISSIYKQTSLPERCPNKRGELQIFNLFRLFYFLSPDTATTTTTCQRMESARLCNNNGVIFSSLSKKVKVMWSINYLKKFGKRMKQKTTKIRKINMSKAAHTNTPTQNIENNLCRNMFQSNCLTMAWAKVATNHHLCVAHCGYITLRWRRWWRRRSSSERFNKMLHIGCYDFIYELFFGHRIQLVDSGI